MFGFAEASFLGTHTNTLTFEDQTNTRLGEKSILIVGEGSRTIKWQTAVPMGWRFLFLPRVPDVLKIEKS